MQLTRNGLKADSAQLPRWRAEFAQTHCLRLPAFIEPALLDFWLRLVGRAAFVPKSETHQGSEFGFTRFVPPRDPALYFLHFLVNQPPLFRLVEAITGCPHVGNFAGRMHRSLPGGGEYLDWHDDISDHRLIGLDIHLSPAPFTGGAFHLRERPGGRETFVADYEPAGSAFLFRVSPAVEHRLTPLTGGAPRTVAVGWFRAQPDWPEYAPTLRPIPPAPLRETPAIL